MAETRNDADSAFDAFIETYAVKYEQGRPPAWSRAPGTGWFEPNRSASTPPVHDQEFKLVRANWPPFRPVWN